MKSIILFLLLFSSISIFADLKIKEEHRKEVLNKGELVRVIRVMSSQSLLVKTKNKKEFLVPLIGLEEIDEKISLSLQRKIVRFIENRVLGKKVILIYSNRKKGEIEVLKAYVYYPQKAHYLLNATLIKYGYAKASDTANHKFKAEFTSLEKEAGAKKLGLWKNKKYLKLFSITEKNKAHPKKLSDAELQEINLCAKITAELYLAHDKQKQKTRVYKKYNLNSQKKLNKYFDSLTKYNHILQFHKKLKKYIQLK